ncbi:MAG: class I SAM-dependent methyltransferase [Solirubrobacterales bacterium]
MPLADKATRAASFGAVADVYDRGRPGYPAAAIEWLLGPDPLEVLDLGAGTGKLTAALLAAGHTVTALEPLEEMREILTAKLPQVTAIDGRAEELPLADSSVDAVVAGSAFHWFDREPALDEIARVLRPPGVFGLLGNRFDTSVDWQRRLRGSGAGVGGWIYRRGHWPSPEELRERFAEVADAPAFVQPIEVDRAAVKDYLASTSRVSTLGPEGRAAYLSRVDRVWDASPELQGRVRAELVWRTVVRRGRGSLR